jgi:hypothetical protein
MAGNRRGVTFAMLTLLAPCVAARAVVFNVNDETTLQAALTAAEANGDHDVINLAAGTYDALFNGGGATFTYSSTEAFDLTLQGAGQLSTAISGNTAFQALNLSGGQGGASLFVRDLTIHSGHLGAASGSLFGAGAMLGAGSGSVTVERVVFLQNSASAAGTATIFGGALHCSAADTCLVASSTFTGNTATSTGSGAVFGGAADFDAGSVELQQVTVSGQTTAGTGTVFGGVLEVSSGSPSFTAAIADLSVTGTSTGTSGSSGGIFGGVLDLGSGGDDAVETVTRAEISGSTITDTGSNGLFGGVVNAGSGGGNEQVTLIKLYLHDNTITESGVGTVFGGALNMSTGGSGSLVTLIDSAIGRNTVSEQGDGDVFGGGVALGGDVRLVHDTIWSNQSSEADNGGSFGGGVFDGSGGGTKDFYNNVIWGNPSTGFSDFEIGGGSNTLNIFNNDYSLLVISGGGNTVNQSGNLSVSPLLSGSDFHLTASSPVIDQALAAAPAEPADDFDGQPRTLGPAPDMGADEFLAIPSVIEVPTLSRAGMAIAISLLALLGFALARKYR